MLDINTKFRVGQRLRLLGPESFPYILEFVVHKNTDKYGETMLRNKDGIKHKRNTVLQAGTSKLFGLVYPVDENCVVVAHVEILS